jgi:hypothetical protein
VSKKARKLNKSRGYDAALPLDLSFAQLQSDEAIAQFLMTPSPSERSFQSGDYAFCSVPSSVYDAHDTHDIPLPELVPDSFDPPTTQFPDFEDEYSSDSTYHDDADLVILRLDGSSQPVEEEGGRGRSRRSQTPAADNDGSASWIMLGDDS